MKKLMLGLAIAVSSLTFAQQFGVKGGVNVANLGGDADGDAKVGFYGGVFMNAPIAANFSIQPEVLYSGQGSKYTESSQDYKTNLDYINVPVMFQYKATPEFYLEAGPQIGFLVSAKDAGIDIKDSVKSIDFGVGLGAGYYFYKGLGFTARYVAGFSDISESSSSSIKNNVFQAGLAYKF